jgi:integrase
VLSAAPNLKHRLLLMTTYAAGLRVGELVRLRVTDVDSQRMLIRVEQGKGKKDRYTLLSQRLLEELRQYYRVYRPTEWLFPQRGKDTPMATATALRIYYAAKVRGNPQGRWDSCTVPSFFALTRPTFTSSSPCRMPSTR